MKTFNRSASLALGTSTLLVPLMIGPLISPNHAFIYHLRDSAPPYFASAALYWGLLWLLLTGLFYLADKSELLHILLWSGIILTAPLLLLKSGSSLGLWAGPDWLIYLAALAPIAIFAGLLWLRSAAPRTTFRAVRDFAATILSFLALAGIAISIQLAWFTWQARDLNPEFQPNHEVVGAARNTSHPRVIWILLDELSYQQVFEQRFAGVSLPAFDQLAAQSTVFTHVIPAGVYTQYAVPSLITGQPIDLIRVSSEGQLTALHNSLTGTWLRYDPADTVFHDASTFGYRNGVAGWFNPYCRMLPGLLDRCFWVYRDTLTEVMSPAKRSFAGISTSLRLVVSYLLRSSYFSSWHRNLHIEDYKDVSDAAAATLKDPSVDFVFFHMPIPHPEGIYDRKGMKFANGPASYVDNLVLADQFLARVRAELENQQQWDSSVVIVMGDHSWRTGFMWAGTRLWTPEDAKASHGGQFDDRPAYLVKMPMQQDALSVDNAFAGTRTRSLMDSIFSNRIHTGQDLQAWTQLNH
jgi:hypothetical protein